MTLSTASTTTEKQSEPFDFFEYGLSHQFGDLHMLMDAKTNMRAIVAIHSTRLGPALGGCRFIPYPSTQAALLDAMRLARGMSYKAALAKLPLGGGKAVIIQPNTPYDRTAYLDAFGRFVESLNGRYITALDSGTTVEDMDRIYQHTHYATGLTLDQGDPAPYTAQGVFYGIAAMVEQVLEKTTLKGVHVAIEGLGHVGWRLATHLHEAGCILTVSDINPQKTQEAQLALGATVVPVGTLHHVACDVLSPCALGGSINDDTIDHIQAPIIAGAANNQLAHTYHGQRLMDKGIAYAVDYVINAGGLLFASSQYFKTKEAHVNEQLRGIGQTLAQIYQVSQKTKQPTNHIADSLAEEILRS